LLVIDLSNKPIFCFDSTELGALQVSRFISRIILKNICNNLKKFKNSSSIEFVRTFVSFVTYHPDPKNEDGSINEKFKITIDEAKMLSNKELCIFAEKCLEHNKHLIALLTEDEKYSYKQKRELTLNYLHQSIITYAEKYLKKFDISSRFKRIDKLGGLMNKAFMDPYWKFNTVAQMAQPLRGSVVDGVYGNIDSLNDQINKSFIDPYKKFNSVAQMMVPPPINSYDKLNSTSKLSDSFYNNINSLTNQINKAFIDPREKFNSIAQIMVPPPIGSYDKLNSISKLSDSFYGNINPLINQINKAFIDSGKELNAITQMMTQPVLGSYGNLNLIAKLADSIYGNISPLTDQINKTLLDPRKLNAITQMMTQPLMGSYDNLNLMARLADSILTINEFINFSGQEVIDENEFTSALVGIVLDLEKLAREKCRELAPKFFWELIIAIAVSLIIQNFLPAKSKNNTYLTNNYLINQPRMIVVKPNIQANLKEIKETYVVLETVRLRNEPTTKSPIIGLLYPNQKVTLIKDQGKWIYITYSDNIEGIPKMGWVCKEFLRHME